MNEFLDRYSKIILFGGGCLAERLYNQNKTIRDRLIGVIDMIPAEKRSITCFHDFKITDPVSFENEIRNGAAVVFSIGSIQVCQCVKQYIAGYSYPTENIIVVNPYSSLRFFMVNDELAQETRIPFTDERYKHLAGLFKDEQSLRLLKMLMASKPFESNEDSYELVRYKDIEDLYYFEEDYWKSFPFDREEADEATILDCGAYIGDSIADICQSVPAKKKYYYAFEPLQDNLQQIIDNKEFLNYCTELFPCDCGVGEFDEEKLFGVESRDNNDGARFISEESQNGCAETWKLQIRSIDGMAQNFKGTLYIKMDIEGSELSALKGAAKTIKDFRPYLAVCLYHRKNDLLEIPLFIESLGVKYDYFLRGGYHTILWAIPTDEAKERKEK